MIKRHFIPFAIVLLFIGVGDHSFAQPPGTPEAIEAAYQKRIKKEYLNRVYIPVDLADAFLSLNELTEEESRRKLLSLPAKEAAKRLHYGLGRWMMVNWSFYSGSRLSHYLKGLGLTYPDDMAQFIIITYHRYLSKEPLDVKPLIDEFVKKREEEYKNRIQSGEVLSSEVRKVDRPAVDSTGNQ